MNNINFITLTYIFTGNVFDYNITLADYNYVYDKALADGLTNEKDIEDFIKDWYEDYAYEDYKNQINKWEEELRYPPYSNDIHGGV